MMTEYMTVKEIGRLADVSDGSVHNAIRLGDLNAVLVGNTYIVEKDAAQEWARELNRCGKRKRGRKPRPEDYAVIAFYVPKRLCDWLHAKAEEEGVAMSDIVNGLLQAEYEKEVR